MGDYCFVLDHSNPARVEVDMDGQPAHRSYYVVLSPFSLFLSMFNAIIEAFRAIL